VTQVPAAGAAIEDLTGSIRVNVSKSNLITQPFICWGQEGAFGDLQNI